MAQRERDVTGDGPMVGPVGGPRRMAPAWLGYSAAAAGAFLGIGHLAVTGGFVVTGSQAPTPAYLAWVFVPVLVAFGFAGAAAALVRPGMGRIPARRLYRITGTAAVLTALLTFVGFASLAFGASPASLFLGPGPYALPGAVLFTALTVSALRARRRTRPVAGLSGPPLGNAPASGRTPA